MNTLEQRGLIDLLRQAAPMLEAAGYGGDPPTDRYCDTCDTYLHHRADCRGVKLLKAIVAALKEYGDA